MVSRGLSPEVRAELVSVVRFGGGPDVAVVDAAARLLFVDALLASITAATRAAQLGLTRAAVVVGLLVLLLGAVEVHGQTLPTGCTGAAGAMKCEWAFDAKAAGAGVHELSFTITEVNGVTFRQTLRISIPSTMLSEASHSAKAVSFKLESPVGVQSISDVTLDGQPFAVAVPVP